MDEGNMSPFLKVVTTKYFATILTLVLSYLLAKVGCGNLAAVWFSQPAAVCSGTGCLCCIFRQEKTNRQGAMLWFPMVFMMGVTFTALEYDHCQTEQSIYD